VPRYKLNQFSLVLHDAVLVGAWIVAALVGGAVPKQCLSRITILLLESLQCNELFIRMSA